MTSNGGQTWTAVTPPGVPAGVIMGVYFRNTKNGWVVSSSASNRTQLVISATTDGGSSWSTSLAGRLDHRATVPMGTPQGDVNGFPAVIGPATWIAVSMDTRQIVTVTGDGAHEASESPAGLPRGGLGDGSFTTTGSGWVVSDIDKCAGFKTGCTETIALFATTDEGAHWTLKLSSTTPG